VNLFDRARERFERLSAGPARNITSITEDSAGGIWVGSFGEGLVRLTIDPRTAAVTGERFVHSRRTRRR
jgi:ligand-binding sensor domain-containing protein